MVARRVVILLFCFSLASGCNVLDRGGSSDVMKVPPYWQSQSQLAHDQLADMRAFHEKEASNMLEDMHVFRNREMQRMAAESKEMKKSTPRNDSNENTEQKDSWAWLNWFNRKSKG